MYDVIVIGAGPAGISASLYAKRANLDVVVFYYGESNLEKAEKIDNYYGFAEGISGKNLLNRGIRQARNLGIPVKKEEVVQIIQEPDGFKITTTKGSYQSKTVIISTGNKKIAPDIKGIKEFEGRGISYCAICDAFFYKNKNVAIIGDGKFALNEAKELKNIVGNITILTNGEKPLKCEFKTNTNVIKEVKGDKKVNQVIFEDGSTLEIDGIFIALGEAGAGDFAKTLGIILEKDNIKVNENMETNIKGIYACGDATGGLLQVCKSVHQGAQSALSATKHIQSCH